MLVLCAAVGIVLGLSAAWAVSRAFLWLRSNLLLPVAIIGWMFAVFVAYSVFALAIEYFDGVSSLLEVLGVIALLLMTLLLLCAALALRQRRIYPNPWLQSFGVLMVESILAILAGVLMYEFTRPYGDTWAMPIAVSFDGALFVGLVLLEAAPPFLQNGNKL